MSAPTDPYKGERERDRIFYENQSAFNEVMSSLKLPSQPVSRGHSGIGDLLFGGLLFSSLLYAANWVRADYLPNGDPISRTLLISFILVLLIMCGAWILRPFFRSRTFKILVTLTLLVAIYWYFSGI
jgi:hypothetical protein